MMVSLGFSLGFDRATANGCIDDGLVGVSLTDHTRQRPRTVSISMAPRTAKDFAAHVVALADGVEPPAPTRWTIESAPQYGTEVLLFGGRFDAAYEGFEPSCVVGWWDGSNWRFGAGDAGIYHDPTHWTATPQE